MFKLKAPKILLSPIRLRVPGIFRSMSHLVGAAPGTLSVSHSSPKPIIRVIQYDENNVTDVTLKNHEELKSFDTETGVTWIDVQGLGDVEALQAIATQFSIHPLALEDMVNVPQRPKIVPYDDSLLWITRMVRIDDDGAIDREQLSIIHSRNWLITFQERPEDVFDALRDRILNDKGNVRRASADYLAYVLLDTVVDGFYPIVEKTSLEMERLEARIMVTPKPEQLSSINQMKWLSTTIKRSMFAQRQTLSVYLRKPTSHIEPKNHIYFNDVLDHVTQLSEMIETQQEHLTGLLNTYLSMVSFRANEVMKVLTIMASIFIPLTFIAGVYGMNFQHMPELSYTWSYPAALGVMFVVAVGMIGFFVKRGWIGNADFSKIDEPVIKDDAEL